MSNPSADGRRPSKKTKQRRAALKFLTNYFKTYDKQASWDKVSDKTFLDDALYGIGVALDEKQHSYAQGWDRFKEKLLEHLGANQ